MLLGSLSGNSAQADDSQYDFDIDRPTLAEVLDEIVQQTGALVLYPPELADATGMSPVRGRYTVDEALEIVLGNTSFSGGLTERGVIFISQEASEETALPESNMNKRNGFIAAVIGLFIGASGAQQVVAQEKESDRGQSVRTLEEIVVTANKREQSLQDTAMSISALGSEEIERRNIVGMGDYLNTIPGVTVQDFGVGENRIVIRGIGTAVFDDASVGSYFGDVPLSVIASLGAAIGAATDLKLVDMERIEVLRGPQGTLYGSGSMGGTVRLIPKTPNLEETEGELKFGFSNTAATGGNNSKMEGVFNIPLIEDQLALRIVGYIHDDSGYVENVAGSDLAAQALVTAFGGTAINEDDVGASEFQGVRASLLWQPNDETEITFTALKQDLDQDGLPEITTSLGGYRTNRLQIDPEVNPRGEFKSDVIEIYNLVAEYDFGSFSLLSSTSTFDGAAKRAIDLSLFGNSRGIDDIFFREGLTQEFRLTSQWESKFQVVAGLYYEDTEGSRISLGKWHGDPAVGATLFPNPNQTFAVDSAALIEQKAVFGEVSYAFTEQTSLTFGGRLFDYTREDLSIITTGSGAVIVNNNVLDEQSHSLKANLSHAYNDDSLIYAQWAQGFRLGRAGTRIPPGDCDVNNDGLFDGHNVSVNADEIESDTLDSYELGGKFSLMDNRLEVNAALYTIQWDGIPVTIEADPICSFGLAVNAGKAESKGVEFESRYYLSDAFAINLGLSYSNAELTEDSSLGSKGSRLPGSAEFNGRIAFDYNFTLLDRDAFLSADYAYMSNFYNDFAQTAELEARSTVGMRAGINLDKFSIEVYGANLTNDDSLIAASGLGGFRTKPRTIGVVFGYQF